MVIHLVDGTYELFRHFYGLRRFTSGDRPLGAVAAVLHTLLQMLEQGATHLGMATDHVIDRVLPQRAVERLQDRRGPRAGAARAV